MNRSPSCSVNVDPDQITFSSDFDPDADPSITLYVLEKKLAEVEVELTAPRPQTDKALTILGKKKRLLESLINSYSIKARRIPVQTIRSYRRKEKRIEKKLRRKAARLNCLRN